MKVYKVIVEKDHYETLTKGPGRSSVEVEQISYHYAANCIGDVWSYSEFLRLDPDLSFIGIFEVLPSIHVIQGDLSA